MAVSQNDINAYLYNVRGALVDYGANISKYQRLGRKDIECSKMNFRLLQYLLRIVVDYFDSDDYENVNFFTLSEIRDIMQHINNICGTNYILDMTPAEDEWTIKGKSYGSSTTLARIKAYGELIGECSGIATTSGSIYTGVTEIYGISNGIATCNGDIWGYAYIAGISNGLATSNGTIFGDPPGIYPISGTSNGISTTNGTLINAVGVPQSYNLHGFGTDSLFAYAGASDPIVLYVDSTDADGGNTDATHGTLEWCLTRTYPRIILFETSGTIDYRSQSDYRMDIDNPYFWLVGGSAPSPGIEVIGIVVEPDANNCLFTDIHFSLGDNPIKDSMDDQGDAVTIKPISNKTVFDHCTIRWGSDEVISAGGTSMGHITISHGFLYEPMNAPETSRKDENNHPFTCGTYDSDITFYKTLFAFGKERSPQSDMTQDLEVINCFGFNGWIRLLANMKDAAQRVIYIGNDARPMNNVFYDSGSAYQDYAGLIHGTIGVGFKMYALDNNCQYRDDNPLATAEECIKDDWGGWSNEGAPMWSINQYNIWDADDTKTNILKVGGSGSRFRDANDIRIIADINGFNRREYLDSVIDLPARTINFGSAAGDISLGYDWNADNQTFDLNYNGGGATTVTLNADTTGGGTPIDDVISHINARIAAAVPHNYSANVEAYKLYDSDGSQDAGQDNWWCSVKWIALRTISAGSGEEIVITNTQCAVSMDLINGTYTGYTTPVTIAARTENTTTHTPPANPHDIHSESPLTNLEVWILEQFGAIGDGYDFGGGGGPTEVLVGEYINDGDCGDKVGLDRKPGIYTLDFSITNGTSSISIVQAHAGTRSFKIDATASGDVGVVAPSFANAINLYEIDYRFSFWLYIPSGQSWNGNVTVKSDGGGNTWYNSTIEDLSLWYKVTCDITLDSADTDIFTISINTTDGADFYYLDDISFQAIFSSISSNEEITNGNCESLLPSFNGNSFTTSSSCSVALSTDQSHGGSQSVKITAITANVNEYRAPDYTDSALSTGYYRLSNWFYIPSIYGYSLDWTSVGFDDGPNDHILCNKGDHHTEDQWVYREGVVYIDTTVDYVWKAYVNPANIADYCYIDDLSMKKLVL